MRYHTEPTQLQLRIEDVLQDFGIDDLYQRHLEDADDAQSAARQAVFDAIAAVLPMTGAAPDWAGGTAPDAIRSAGPTDTDQARATDVAPD